MKIVLTGGGTAGHVTPHLALLPRLQAEGFEVEYIGSYNGIEKELVTGAGIPYHGIDSGKLRRYFDLKNFTDPFRVLHGYVEAAGILRKLRPDVLFSKGGFVSVPVVIAAHRLKIPVIIHESDMTPGLANKLCFSSADKVCCNFPETVALLPKEKAVLSGSPIREELLHGTADRARVYTGFTPDKPVLMVIGGSLGSVAVNKAVRSCLPRLLPHFQVVHLCGKGNLDPSLVSTAGYVQYEYINKELKDLFALADLVISRAGANSICELLALRKPNILVPLPGTASRGDQILNAESFKKQGFSEVLEEASITDELLADTVEKVYANKEAYIAKMEASPMKNGVETIMGLILELSGK